MKNPRMPMTSIAPYCVVIYALVRISELCSPVPQVDDNTLALRGALATAEQNSVEGRIAFRLDQSPVPLAGRAPTCNGPAQPLTLIRAGLGQTAVFSCSLYPCLCHNTSLPDLDEVLWNWNYQSCRLRQMLCKGYPLPFVYSQTRTTTTAYLFIHNVTYETVGSVYCYCQCTNGTRRECINHAYELTPILSPADVFETPVLNVTHPAGTTVTLLSKLRIRMTMHKDHRYIVRYNRRIIWAQASHPLHALKEAMFPYGISLSLNENNLSMTIPYLPKSFSGQFEVWVRPYMEEDEFVMQTINLKLT